jgi:hypothetical protein
MLRSVPHLFELAVAHDSTSISAAIFFALGGGVIGSVLTAFVQGWHRKREQLRELATTAADDFATGVLQAITFIRDHASGFTTPAEDTEGLRLVDEAIARRARVELLIGPESKSAKTANLVSAGLISCRGSAADSEPTAATRDKIRIASDHLLNFTECAHDDIWGRSLLRRRSA